MKEFFHGWRRKAGVVTLVMACVMMVLWLRSWSADEGIYLPTVSGRSAGIRSSDGRIELRYAWYTESDPPGVPWPTKRFDAYHLDKPIVSISFELTPSCELRKWHQMLVSPSATFRGKSILVVLPDVTVALLLTLLSAYLILWKPRKRESAPPPSEDSTK